MNPSVIDHAGDCYPVQWTGRRAVVALPDHIDVSNSSQISEELLSVINRGATALIADMTATVSCDDAGANAVARAHHRAVANGTQLRLVVTAQIVRRVLRASGLHRLISMYPSLEAATAADQRTGVVIPGLNQSALRKIIDVLSDGVALTNADGRLVLANQALADMFGYKPAELAGRPIGALLPVNLRTGTQRAGLRGDGTTFGVEVSLVPLWAAAGQVTLVVVKAARHEQR